MVMVSSTMVALGTPAPDFALPDTVSGKMVRLSDAAQMNAPATLVMFLCNHCPFVKHVRAEVAKLAKEYRGKGVFVVGISSNDVRTHPDDAPDKMAAEARDAGYSFPYLYDETQDIAKAYRAACTPDFFVYDAKRQLAYRGRLDDSRPGNGKPLTGADLRAALDAVLAGRAVPEPHLPSAGCNIKWKAGAEPAWFPK